MPAQNRRSSFSSSTASSLAKRHVLLAKNAGKSEKVLPPHLAKRRPPLSDLTNQSNGIKAPEATAIMVNTRKAASTSAIVGDGLHVNIAETSTHIQLTVASIPAHYGVAVSPSRSDELSVSADGTMFSCESFRSPEVEYIDNVEVSPPDSIDRMILSHLYISEHAGKTVNIYNGGDALAGMGMDVEKVDIDFNYTDPQPCAIMACDIYKHLRASEMKKRPMSDFMERVQKDITASMRAILIDWLVEVAEEYKLVPDTLYLTVNYIDRYLSGNMMYRQQLQLLGVASLMIASRFVRAAQAVSEVPSMQLECLANYISELSLLEYKMLRYAPSMIAASSVFLAKYVLVPTKRPWDWNLQHYTLYQPSDLRECIKDLHCLCLNGHSSSLPAIPQKFSQHKYKCVAQKHFPPSIPAEFFHHLPH
ncbi:hypothetical protein SAY86_020427 [Trapa natans]|uniref:Cyclin N-terminal domain-containing protein n=1 Tax=Trapa natans TaxID=22666 RepID=A0AAN7R7Q5_TRANT|nr:hypothetical protein SAY86_020427 [Trapa natans]